jgi:hypothetical protein
MHKSRRAGSDYAVPEGAVGGVDKAKRARTSRHVRVGRAVRAFAHRYVLR